MRRWVWSSSALAPVALVGAWLLAQTRQPARYDAARDTISALAARGAVDPWIMTTGLATLGACHLATAAGFPDAGRLARSLQLLGGAATVVVAASPQPAAAHVPAAAVGFVTLALWPACTPRRLRRAGVPVSAVLVALLLWFGVELHGGGLVGASERALAAAEALAPLVMLLAHRRLGAAQPAGVRTSSG